ncbi:hypothetical protein MMC17_008644 [Xylographa soralifera]|nr:hypothetical protein [Xylographa soralifera]
MKFSAAILGSQLVLAALSLALPLAAEHGAAVARSAFDAPVARGIVAREEDATDESDEDVYNGKSCLKLKRDAESAAATAAAAYKRYESALAKRTIVVREEDATDETDQDVYNGSGCLKLKRDAEAAAGAAAMASMQYEAALAKRGLVTIAI